MSVEEILILVQIVVIANLQEALVRVTVPELPQACPGEPIQSSPQDFVVKAPHIDLHSPRACFASDNVYGFWRKRKCRPRCLPVQARWSLFCHFELDRTSDPGSLARRSAEAGFLWSRRVHDSWEKTQEHFSYAQFSHSAACPARSLCCYSHGYH